MLPLTAFTSPIERAGGPMQFLSQHSKELLGQRLMAFFEPKADISYSRKESLLVDDDQEHIFRLVDLGFGDDATTCGAPRLVT